MAGTVKEARLNFPARLLRGFSYLLVHAIQRPKVCGPKPVIDGPAIFVCRHVGMMDPVILMVEYYRRMLHPLVAKDYFEANGFTKKFYPIAQCYAIERHKVSTNWLDVSLAALEKGEGIIIFPEGRRNKTGTGLLPFHNGAALLALKSGAPIIPVWNAVWKFPHRYRLAIGEPIHLDQLPPEGQLSEWLTLQTETIRSAVAALEPLVE